MQWNLTKNLNLPYIEAGLVAFKPWCMKCSENIRVWEAQTESTYNANLLKIQGGLCRFIHWK